jgi:hypothetical protein
MTRKKAGRAGVKIHRNYTVDEAARALGVAKITVRRWIKQGLPVLTDQKPMLILGSDLSQFPAKRKAPSQPCQPFECYCVKCHAPKRPAGDMAEFVPLSPTLGNLRAICPACGTLMHKRMKRAALDPLGAVLDVTFTRAVPRLREPDNPSPNDAFRKERQTHA